MENYRYFNRDLSWLSFNHHVLREAADRRLPLYERIKFIGIFTSNLEEFYQVRVAAAKAIVAGGESEDLSRDDAQQLLVQLNDVIQQQLVERKAIYDEVIAELEQHGIVFYQSFSPALPMHEAFLRRFFLEEVYPYLQPVKLEQDGIRCFLRDKRVYIVVDACSIETGEQTMFLIKLPYSKVPRFVELPSSDNTYYIMYLEDIIKANLSILLPGYHIYGSHCCKISRDADVLVDELLAERKIKQIKEKVKKRKIGAVARFVYEESMNEDFLCRLIAFFSLNREEGVPANQHLNLEDLTSFPNPTSEMLHLLPQPPVHVAGSERLRYMFRKIAKKDRLLWYPYHSFDHFIQFLYEAVHDPRCTDIMITQYRVAEHSEVINTLIAAAQNGKRVTVFVELKARFDEENNLETAELMRKAGIHILFSIPGLKVHAKVALVLRRDAKGEMTKSYACISTGNFNEVTARAYADVALFTANKRIVKDLHQLFLYLQREVDKPVFDKLLVSRFNLTDRLNELIDFEIRQARAGKRAEIVLKMNAIQDHKMISRLYEASEAGVHITLIVRGICCLVTDEDFSRNITVLRIVDRYLEHTRIWYFLHGGEELLFLGSPDWMRRNLYKRIEAATPVLDKKLKKQIMDFLTLQRSSTDKTSRRGAELLPDTPEQGIRAQMDFYRYLLAETITGLEPKS